MITAAPTWTEDDLDAPLPPLAPGLPLLGSLAGMAGDPLPFMIAMYQRFGPVFRVQVLGRQFTVLAGPEANLFMAADGDLLHSRDVWGAFSAEWNAPHLILAQSGAAHAEQRGVQKAGYARGRILERLPEAVAIAREHLQSLRPGQRVALVPLMQRIVTDQLGALIIGRRPGAEADAIRTMQRAALNALVVRRWPRIVLRSPSYRRARARVLALGNALLAERAHRAAPAANPDLIDDLLAAHARRSPYVTDRDLLVAAMGPYVAGLDTVANTLSFLLVELIRHPDVLAAARAELDRAFDPLAPTPEQLRELQVLRGAAMETLRLYPVSGVNARHAARGFTFAGCRVPRDEAVLIAGGVAHYLPSLYRDPHRFDVTRYTPSRAEHRQRGAYAPFGTGPHTCLGAGLADIQIVVTAATILHALDLHLEPGVRLRVRVDPTITLGRRLRVQVARRADARAPEH